MTQDACFHDLDGESRRLARLFEEQGLDAALRELERIVRKLVPLLAVTCSVKPWKAFWCVKILEYRRGRKMPPALYRFDDFLTSEANRNFLLAHPGSPVLLDERDNIIANDIFEVQTDSGMTVCMANTPFQALSLNFFARRGHAFVEKDRLLLQYLLAGLQHILGLRFAEDDPYRTVLLGKHACRAIELIRLCPSLSRLDAQIGSMARSDMLALVTGETGVGKDVIAKAIHEESVRGEKPFIKVNCGAIPETLLDSELFGYEKGAFTGATVSKAGYFEQADGGTIFLDEIGELSLAAQVRLLHVLENGQIQRVGAHTATRVDVRVIAATNRNLWMECENNTFREDLCYRLFVCHLEVPPLRERVVDIPMLLWYFLNQQTQHLQLPPKLHISKDEIARLMAYDWPGNVRELKHTIERALLYTRDSRTLELSRYTYGTIRKPRGQGTPAEAFPGFDEYVGAYLRKVLQYTQGRVKGPGGAAEILKLDPSTLRYKIRKYGLTELMRGR